MLTAFFWAPSLYQTVEITEDESAHYEKWLKVKPGVLQGDLPVIRAQHNGFTPRFMNDPIDLCM